jgi:perosamine synthetase
MERIHDLIARKREILAFYRERLNGLSCISLNPEPFGIENGAWMPTVVFSNESSITREKLQIAFAEENADARVFFWPLSGLSIFPAVRSNRHAWDIPSRAINLPSYHDISEEDLARVAGVVISLA